MSSPPARGTTLTTAIRGVSPASWRRAWRLAGVVVLTLACAVIAAPAWGADDAVAVRERGAAAIDAFVDHYRRTGDKTSKLAELNAMAPALVAAVRTFIGRGDNADAAQTLIPLGDIHRMQGRWELALTAYRMAENVARQAADPTLIARALKVQAQIDSSQRDYGRALAHIEEALALLRPLPDRKLFGDALLVLADIQVKLADFAGAADSVSQAMTIADERQDDGLRFYALLDRGSIWMAMGFCDAVRPTDRCLQQIDLALKDYAAGHAMATRLGWAGLAREMDGFIWRAELQAQNVRSMLALNNIVGQLSNRFKPRTASDVSVSERFTTANPEAAAVLRPVLDQLKATDTRYGGYSDVSAIRTRFTDGLLHHMQGDFRTALASYRAALDLFEADRGKLQDEAGRSGYFANKLGFYYRPIEILLEQGNHAEAFDLFERSKSRALADPLASRDISFPTEQERSRFAGLMEQRSKVAGLQSNLFALLAQNRPEAEIARARADVAAAEQRYQTIFKQIEGSAGKARDLVVAKPATLGQLQQAMREQGFETLMYLSTRAGRPCGISAPTPHTYATS